MYGVSVADIAFQSCNDNNSSRKVCIPEVVHELFELIRSSRQRDDDVNQDIGCVHPFTFDLHQGSEGSEED